MTDPIQKAREIQRLAEQGDMSEEVMCAIAVLAQGIESAIRKPEPIIEGDIPGLSTAIEAYDRTLWKSKRPQPMLRIVLAAAKRHAAGAQLEELLEKVPTNDDGFCWIKFTRFNDKWTCELSRLKDIGNGKTPTEALKAALNTQGGGVMGKRDNYPIDALSIHNLLTDLSLNEENICGKKELTLAELFVDLYADTIYKIAKSKLESMK